MENFTNFFKPQNIRNNWKMLGEEKNKNNGILPLGVKKITMPILQRIFLEKSYKVAKVFEETKFENFIFRLFILAS
jgi:hypothetical protein